MIKYSLQKTYKTEEHTEDNTHNILEMIFLCFVLCMPFLIYTYFLNFQ